MIQIGKQRWGSLDSGEQIDLYTIRNSHGMETAITNYGGRVVSLKVRDRQGKFADVVLGFDDLAGYVGKNPYFGAIVGRYANRIAGARFQLNGSTYMLARNSGSNALHGGLRGFDKVAWSAREAATGTGPAREAATGTGPAREAATGTGPAREAPTGNGPALELHYFSKDGEEGYPGNLDVVVRYAMTEEDELKIDYEATTDKDTVLNLTNHSYFDLAGAGSGNIAGHVITIFSDQFTPVNANLIPTGEVRDVEGTPFDFRAPEAIRSRIDEKHEQLQYGEGYDHNFVLKGDDGGVSAAARVVEPNSGRVLEVSTTEPGMQFYTGNHLGMILGKAGKAYGQRSAFCLETQHFPDSPNHPNFPSTELKAGQRYRSTTIFRFSIDA